MKILRKFRLVNHQDFKYIDECTINDLGSVYQAEFKSSLYDGADHFMTTSLKNIKAVVRKDLCEPDEKRMKWEQIQ